jgi:hypothetical protein
MPEKAGKRVAIGYEIDSDFSPSMRWFWLTWAKYNVVEKPEMRHWADYSASLHRAHFEVRTFLIAGEFAAKA